MEYLEIEPDPNNKEPCFVDNMLDEEEDTMAPLDLRQRRPAGFGFLTHLLLPATLGIGLFLGVLKWGSLLRDNFDIDVEGPQHQHQHQPLQVTQERQLLVHVGFDGSESLGARLAKVPFKDIDGTLKDPIEIFKDHGYGWSRLRVMVDPDGTHGLFQTMEYVKKMAEDIVHTNSMKLLLDFHYSHWWADPENQQIPLKWRNNTDDEHDYSSTSTTRTRASLLELEECVYNHTRITMEALIDQGTIPDAVQIGNEVNAGMLWDTGKIVDGDMDNFVRLTNSAIRAIEDSFTDEEDARVPQIVMHIASGGWTQFTQDWFTNFTNAGGKFDIIGLSYYPFWHGSLQDLSDNMNNLKQIFPDKNVWVVETAYYWTETSNDYNNLPFEQSQDGQVAYLKALREVLLNHDRETAVFYWGSHWTQPEVWMNSDETWQETANRSLFDENAQALKAIDALVGL